MTPLQSQAIQLLALPPERYASFDDKLKQQLQEQLGAIAEAASAPGRPAESPPLLVLGAPAEVVIDERTPAPAVPVLVGSVRSGTREWQVNFRSNLHLFLRRLDGSSTLEVIQPLRSLRRGKLERVSGAGTPPTGIAAATVLSDIHRVDLSERLGATPAPGSYAVTAIAVDWLSNTVPIRIRGPRPAAAQVDAPPPFAGVRHVLDPRTGLDAQVEVTPSVQGNEPVRMRVALSLPPEAVAPAAPAGGPPSWSGHVVLIAPDETPRLVPLRVPAARVADAAAAAPRHNVVFQLDLRAALPDLSGRWLVYLEAGTRWLGPWPVQIGP